MANGTQRMNQMASSGSPPTPMMVVAGAFHAALKTSTAAATKTIRTRAWRIHLAVPDTQKQRPDRANPASPAQGGDQTSAGCALHEHPAMALEVFGAVALPVLVSFDLGDDRSPSSLCLREMGIDVVDVDQHAVDDIGHRRPPLCRLAGIAMVTRCLVIGGWAGQHDDAVARLHFAMAQPAVLAQHAGALREAKRGRQPIHRGGTVLIGDHGNHVRIGRCHCCALLTYRYRRSFFFEFS